MNKYKCIDYSFRYNSFNLNKLNGLEFSK